MWPTIGNPSAPIASDEGYLLEALSAEPGFFAPAPVLIYLKIEISTTQGSRRHRRDRRDEFRWLAGQRSGKALVEALQMLRHRSKSIAPPRLPMPVRDADL
jgi:hypothetical protein